MAVSPVSQSSPFIAFGSRPHAVKTRFGEAFPTEFQRNKDCVPTPPAVADRMIDLLDIRPGMSVLEPSAGTGNIAGQVREKTGITPDVVEYEAPLREALREKGYNVVGNDFMAYSGKKYDRIIMNPPFSKWQHAAHVQHAYEMLKPGGRLAAIVPHYVVNLKAGGSKPKAFVNWLNKDCGNWAAHKLDDRAFVNDESHADIPTRILVINKPAEAKKAKKRPKFGGLDLVA